MWLHFATVPQRSRRTVLMKSRQSSGLSIALFVCFYWASSWQHRVNITRERQNCLPRWRPHSFLWKVISGAVRQARARNWTAPSFHFRLLRFSFKQGLTFSPAPSWLRDSCTIATSCIRHTLRQLVASLWAGAKALQKTVRMWYKSDQTTITILWLSDMIYSSSSLLQNNMLSTMTP